MDHSIQGYLNRRTTEELQALLVYCLEEENCGNYRDTALEILEILKKRYIPTEISTHTMQALEQVLQHFEDGTDDPDFC